MIKWYAIYYRDSGDLYGVASVDLDDEDTLTHESGQPYSDSGLKGIASPEVLEAQGLVAIEARNAQGQPVNPQEPEAQDQDGQHEWQPAGKHFVFQPGTVRRHRTHASLKKLLDAHEADMRRRGEL